MKKVLLFAATALLSLSMFAAHELVDFSKITLDSWGGSGAPEVSLADDVITIKIVATPGWQWGNQVKVCLTNVAEAGLSRDKEYKVSFHAEASTIDCGGVTFRMFERPDGYPLFYTDQNYLDFGAPYDFESEWLAVTDDAQLATNGVLIWDFGWDPPQTITISNLSLLERGPQAEWTIDVSANNEDFGSVSGGGTYEEGSSITLTATPNEGYQFVSWNDGNTDNPRVVIVSEDVTYTAIFEPKETSTLPVINLSTAHSIAYTNCVSNPTLKDGVLTISYEAGTWEWAGVEFDLDNIKEIVSISFDYRGVTSGWTTFICYLRDSEGVRWWNYGPDLSLSHDDWYSVQDYLPNETLWDDTNHKFGDKPFTQLGFIANPSESTTGTFELRNVRVNVQETKSYILNVQPNNAEYGSISGGGTYNEGDIATLIAIPNEGYDFVSWSDGNTDNPRVVTVIGDATYIAYFEDQNIACTYTIKMTDAYGDGWEGGAFVIEDNGVEQTISLGGGFYETVPVQSFGGTPTFTWNNNGYASEVGYFVMDANGRVLAYRQPYTTFVSEFTIDDPCALRSVPAPISGLQASLLSDHTWHFRWDANSDAQSYLVKLYNPNGKILKNFVETAPELDYDFSEVLINGDYRIEVYPADGDGVPMIATAAETSFNIEFPALGEMTVRVYVPEYSGVDMSLPAKIYLEGTNKSYVEAEAKQEGSSRWWSATFDMQDPAYNYISFSVGSTEAVRYSAGISEVKTEKSLCMQIGDFSYEDDYDSYVVKWYNLFVIDCDKEFKDYTIASASLVGGAGEMTLTVEPKENEAPNYKFEVYAGPTDALEYVGSVTFSGLTHYIWWDTAETQEITYWKVISLDESGNVVGAVYESNVAVTISPSPYVIEDLAATPVGDNTYKISWNFKDGVPGFWIYVSDASNNTLISKYVASSDLMVEGDKYVFITPAFGLEGQACVEVQSYDGENYRGYKYTYFDVSGLLSMTDAKIRVLIPTDNNMDISNGVWFWWWPVGETTGSLVKATEEGGRWFSADIHPNSTGYQFVVVNKDVENEGWDDAQQSDDSPAVGAADACFALASKYTFDSKWGLYATDCSAADHDYRPTLTFDNSVAKIVTVSIDAAEYAPKYQMAWRVKDSGDDFSYSPALYFTSENHTYTKFFDVTEDTEYDYRFFVNDEEWNLMVGDINGTFTVKAVVPKHTITVIVAPGQETWGHVNIGGGITVGDFEEGASITLYAEPFTGYRFTEWNDGNKNATRTIRVGTADATFVAYFEPDSYYISAIANYDTRGTVTGGGDYVFGGVAILTATPNEHYQFSRWSDGSTDNPRYVAVMGNATYTAIFTPEVYAVNVYSSNTELGIVSAPSSAEYASTIVLTAQANTGYHFTQWSDGNTDNPRYVYVTGEVTLTVDFVPDVYAVNANSNNSEYGSVSAPTSAEYASTITLTAKANTGYHFTQWSDGNTDNPRYVYVTGEVTLTVDFAPDVYAVNANSNNSEYGSVSAPTSAEYASTITLTAQAYTGYHFIQWSDGNADNPRYVYVTEEVAMTAEFAPDQYVISVSSSNGTLGTVSGGGLYTYGAVAKLEAKPNAGYQFNGWTDGNTDNPRYVSVLGNASYTAIFGVKMCTLTLKANDIMAGGVKGAGTFEYGEQVEISARANSGYQFVKWSNGETYNPYVFTIVDDMELEAIFTKTQAEEVTDVGDVEVTPQENSATIVWPQVDNTYTYSLIIWANAEQTEKVCTLTFNASGYLINIDFSKKARSAYAQEEQISGFSFTVTGLESDTQYFFKMAAKDSENQEISSEEGSFKTTKNTATAVDAVVGADSQAVKFLRNGTLYILRDGKTYNAQGARVE